MRKPNILIVMVDQLNGTLFPDGPAEFLHAPHLKALAARSARFRNNYTSSPLCAPARASFMAGQLPSRTECLRQRRRIRLVHPDLCPSPAPRRLLHGLSGKMHFVGPDQLHGFEERLTTDIYPADFGWTPDYRKPGERIDWWYHNLGSVTGAGVAEITNQMEYDDEVAFLANQKLYHLARERDDAERRPWCLTVSFTHPHDPYVARKKILGSLRGLPSTRAGGRRDRVRRSRTRIRSGSMHACDYARLRHHAANDVRRSRRAYFANISYLDEKIGELVDTLDAHAHARRYGASSSAPTTATCLASAGLWFKMSFFEGSVRVPLMIAGPGDCARPASCAGLQSRRDPDALRPRRDFDGRDRALDGRQEPRADHRGRRAGRPRC